MKKIIFASAFLIFITNCVTAQAHGWHLATDTLKYPASLSSIEVSVGWINDYDTVVCYYQLLGDREIFVGYKRVYKMKGFYIDDLTTIGMFFDARKRRVNNVEKYYID